MQLQQQKTKLNATLQKFQHLSWGIITSSATTTTTNTTTTTTNNTIPNCLGAISCAETTFQMSEQSSLKMAQNIQKSLLFQQQKKRTKSFSSRTGVLHDPAEYKRMKLQPRKELKLLEKKIRKQRVQICDGLAKKHKEFHKLLMYYT